MKALLYFGRIILVLTGILCLVSNAKAQLMVSSYAFATGTTASLESDVNGNTIDM